MKKVYHRILEITGNVIVVRAEGIFYGELARITSAQGQSLAEVIRLKEDLAYLQVFSGCSGLTTGDEVLFLRHSMRVSCSDNLMGRVFDGTGAARDKGPLLSDSFREIAGPSVNPAKRLVPSQMIHTGIPMIDVFNSLVESQKISIFTSAGEPYNELLARIALQAEVDILILGGMGLRYDDYLFFRDTLSEAGVLPRSILFIHTASDPIVECIAIPDLSLSVAEKFALDGKKVLVLLSDMTNFCDALKEISIIMEQIPSNRGYPGDLYTQLATRYEKAVSFEGLGSVTLLSVTTMPGNDVTHPIPDNTGYITEGQYYLDHHRIEPFGSLSRLKQLVNKKTREDHRVIMDSMVHLYANFQETMEKKAMGFRMSEWDRKLLQFGKLFEEKLMDLDLNLPLLKALDQCWEILAICFRKEETGIRRELIEKFWPKSIVDS